MDSSAGANFRIYYTRTLHNATDSQIEKDCTIQEPNSLEDGFPREIVDLGVYLEDDYAYYQDELQYPAANIYREPSTGRYPVSIASDPLWKCEDGHIVIDQACWQSAAVTFRKRMAFGRNFFATNLDIPSQPIDYLRSTDAHELFHAIQYTYRPESCDSDPFTCNQIELFTWNEGTAIWASTKARPLCGYCINPSTILQFPSLPLFTRKNDGKPFLFAFYLEENIANNNPEIIKRIWEQFQANDGGSMSATINQVLEEPPYNSNIKEAIISFARWNYFLNVDTFGRPVEVYRDWQFPATPTPFAPFQGSEWELYREFLEEVQRSDSNEFAGARTDRRVINPSFNNLPLVGPSQSYSSTVGSLGAAYIEFTPETENIELGSSLEVTFFTDQSIEQALDHGQVEAIGILNFGTTPNPTGTTIMPNANTNIGPNQTKYTFRVRNFNQCDRVVVILDAFENTTFFYQYEADLLPPAAVPESQPCTIETP